MKKSFAWAALSVASLLMLASCGNNNQPASSASTPTSSVTSTPSSEPVSTPTSESSSAATVDHFPGPVTSIAEGATLRDYDERFDAMLEDMSGATLNGQGEIAPAVLRSVVDSNLGEGFACSPDAAIYKMATGTVKFESQAAIGFKMRVVKGSLKLADLVLDLRGNDDPSLFPIEVGESVNVDGEANPELSGEWQDITISLDDAKDGYYQHTDGSATTMKVSDGCLGFHLFAHSDHEVGAVIEISEVYVVDGAGSKSTLDSFSRANIGDAAKTEAAAWWCGTTAGGIVRKGIQLGGEATYVTPTLDAKYNNIVLTAAGDWSGMTINDVPFASWKDVEGNPIVNLVDGAYASYAINLTNSGIAGEKLTLKSTTDVRIASVFSTNFEQPNLNLVYPRVNAAQASLVDDFNRTQNGFSDNWDSSVDPEDEKTSHLNGIVSYSMGDSIKLDGADLVLPATDGYAELTIGSKNAYKGAQYVVFDIKDGADLNNFRFSFGGNGAHYLNSTYASEGVPTIENKDIVENPYAHDGYTWYIIDLSLIADNTDDTSAAMNIYYTGSEELHINAVYLMEKDVAFTATGRQVFEGEAAKVDLDLADYNYITGLDMTATDSLVRYEVKGDGEATFDSFRVEYNGVTSWVKDGGVVAYVDGKKVGVGTLIPTDWCTITFDLVSSGYTAGVAGPAHLHTGGGFTGKLSVRAAEKGQNVYSTKVGEDTGDHSVAVGAYEYLGAYNIQAAGVGILKLTIKGDGEVATLANFRTGNDDVGVRWISHSAESEHIDAVYADGTPVDANAVLPTEGVAIMLDMSVFGNATGRFHLHYSGDNFAQAGTISISDITAVYQYTPYSVILG